MYKRYKKALCQTVYNIAAMFKETLVRANVTLFCMSYVSHTPSFLLHTQ